MKLIKVTSLSLVSLLWIEHAKSFESLNMKTDLKSNHGQEIYTWDNWLAGELTITSDNPQWNRTAVGRFSLEAPRQIFGMEIGPNERHDWAKIGFYLEKDPQTWVRLGTAIDISPTWSGTIYRCDNCPFDFSKHKIKTGQIQTDLDFHISTDQQLVLFYTERTFLPDPLGQRIVMGYFDEKEQAFFQMTQPVLDPWEKPEQARKRGYFIESNEIISAWRDPFVVKEDDGSLHLFFAARFHQNFYDRKLKATGLDHYHPRRNSTVGHAIFNPSQQSWDLQEPLILPATAVQYELPQILKHQDRYYLILVQAEWDVSTAEAARNESPRRNSLVGFYADHLKGPWLPIDGNTPKILDFDDLYGLTLKEINGKVYASGFFEERIQMTNLVEIDISNLVSSLRDQVKEFESVNLDISKLNHDYILD